MKKIIVALLAVLVVLSLCGCDKKDYNEAIELYKAGDYEAAQEMFLELGDYELAAKYASQCQGGIVGCTIHFGTEQEPWTVLAVEDGKALLICDVIYAERPEEENPTHFGTFPFFGEDSWEDSSIRAWMQGEYFEDRSYTWARYVSEVENGGVTDTLFCLTAQQAQEYFSGNNDRMAVMNEDVADRGWAYQDASGRVGWWLMPEDGVYYYVDSRGEITQGDGFEWNISIRPACWIDLSVYMMDFENMESGGNSASAR